jgi:hypothetical protein
VQCDLDLVTKDFPGARLHTCFNQRGTNFDVLAVGQVNSYLLADRPTPYYCDVLNCPSSKSLRGRPSLPGPGSVFMSTLLLRTSSDFENRETVLCPCYGHGPTWKP